MLRSLIDKGRNLTDFANKQGISAQTLEVAARRMTTHTVADYKVIKHLQPQQQNHLQTSG